MTEHEIRMKPVDFLDNYVGIKEGSSAHKSIIDIFNKSGLCKRYMMTTKDAWCATAVSAAFIASGLSSIFPCVECSCNQMVALAKKHGIWVEKDSYIPKVGDVILYDWQDSGVGDNTGFPDHVGIIADVSEYSLYVIEGNYSDTVKYRVVKVDGKNIRGFITPKYSSIKAEVETDDNDSKKKQSDPIAKTAIKQVDDSDFFDSKLKRTFKTTAQLNMRSGAGTDHKIIAVIPKGEKVRCYGYYSKSSNGTKWFSVAYNYKGKSTTGFCSSKYLK